LEKTREKHAKEVDSILKLYNKIGEKTFVKTNTISDRIEAYIPKTYAMFIDVFNMSIDSYWRGMSDGYETEDYPIFTGGPLCNVAKTKDLLSWWKVHAEEKGYIIALDTPASQPITRTEVTARWTYANYIPGNKNFLTLVYDPPEAWKYGWYFYGYCTTKDDIQKVLGATGINDADKAIGFAVNAYDVTPPALRGNNRSGGGVSDIYYFEEPNPYTPGTPQYFIYRNEHRAFPIGGKLYKEIVTSQTGYTYTRYATDTYNMGSNATLIYDGKGEWDTETTKRFHIYKEFEQKISTAKIIASEISERCSESPTGDFPGEGCACQV
jgi:RNA polymerase subunit RPABC4/transcription elongation factor Spt4